MGHASVDLYDCNNPSLVCPYEKGFPPTWISYAQMCSTYRH